MTPITLTSLSFASTVTVFDVLTPLLVRKECVFVVEYRVCLFDGFDWMEVAESTPKRAAFALHVANWTVFQMVADVEGGLHRRDRDSRLPITSNPRHDPLSVPPHLFILYKDYC